VIITMGRRVDGDEEKRTGQCVRSGKSEAEVALDCTIEATEY